MGNLSETKRYLGDAVYADVDRFGCLVLTTENGIEVTNRIVLEDITYDALLRYVSARNVFAR